jgi:hypothetical protein
MEAADLAGAEHDVAGHDPLTFVWVRMSGSADVQGGDDQRAAGAEDGELVVDLDAKA